jgi:hypothetical protein
MLIIIRTWTLQIGKGIDCGQWWGNEEPRIVIDISNNEDDDYDMFSSIVNSNDDDYIKELAANKVIDLRKVMQYDPAAFKKKITNLCKIRKLMVDNMTTSGTHDNKPWNFVEAAMQQYPGYTKISVYYFFTWYEYNLGIEAQFVAFLDDSIKGDTTTLCSPDSEQQLSHKKKRDLDDVNIQTIMKQGNEMIKIMEDSAKDRKTNFEKSELEKNKRATFWQR